jgi:hypothetical protein
MLYATLATKDLPILIQKKTDKRDPLFIVFSSEKPDFICINSTGKFEADQSIPLIEKSGDSFEFTFFNNPDCSEYAKKIELELSVKASYSYRVLEYKGFISPEVSAAIALNMFNTQEFLHETDTGLDNADRIATMNKLMALGKPQSLTHVISGVQTVSQLEGSQLETDGNENF